MSKSILYLARHGKTDQNIPGLTRTPANSDIPLNSVGKMEARKLGEYFRDKEISPTIYTAPDQRCKETARIITEVINAPLFVDPGLKSWDYGSIGLEEELKPYQKNWDLIPPDGEPYKKFAINFKVTLNSYWLARRPILLITHSRNLYYLEWLIEELPEIPVSGGETGVLWEVKTKLKD